MNFIMRLLYPPRTLGSSATKTTSINDELGLIRTYNVREHMNAMELVVGPSWKQVPVREMMGLVNTRFGGEPIDYSKYEVEPVLHLLKSHASDLSHEQVKFLRTYDHLPRSKEKLVGMWMDKAELAAYERDNQDAIHKKKMDYFIMMNGIVAAFSQSMGATKAPPKVKKPFQLSYIHIGIISIVILGLIALVIL